MAGEARWDCLARAVEYKERFERPSLHRDDLLAMLAQLKPRERRVIELRFGLYTDRLMKLQEVADVLKRGVTRERVRLVEMHAIRRLRVMHAKQKASEGDGGG